MFTLRTGLLKLLLAALVVMGITLMLTGACATTDLHELAQRNPSAESVESALNDGADPNAQNSEGQTPLHVTLQSDADTQLVRVLVDGGADLTIVDISGEQPLHYAAALSEAAVVSLLLDAGADSNARDNRGETPLHKATFIGEPAVIELLVERGVDINAPDNDGETPLLVALSARQVSGEDRLAVPRMLLELGADPNVNDALGIAMGDAAMAALLLEYGADPNAPIQSEGDQPRWWLTRAPHMTGVLLDGGADIDGMASFQGERMTRLHKAIIESNYPPDARSYSVDVIARYEDNPGEMVAVLLGKGADTEIASERGYTPLLQALIQNQPRAEIVELLLNHGADATALTPNGLTACAVAQNKEALQGTAVLDRLCEGVS